MNLLFLEQIKSIRKTGNIQMTSLIDTNSTYSSCFISSNVVLCTHLTAGNLSDMAATLSGVVVQQIREALAARLEL